jgi:hypothetical protein
VLAADLVADTSAASERRRAEISAQTAAGTVRGITGKALPEDIGLVWDVSEGPNAKANAG